MRDDAEADECARNHITMETIIGGLADSSLGVAGSTDWSTAQYSTVSVSADYFVRGRR